MMALLLVDLDGTIRKTKSGAVCPQTSTDQELLPGVLDTLNRYQMEGWRIIGISNQGGCEAVNPETGKPYQTIKSVIAQMRYLLKFCSPIHSIFFCPNLKSGNEIAWVCRPWWLKVGTIQHEDRTDMGCHPDYYSEQDFRKPRTGMLEVAHRMYEKDCDRFNAGTNHIGKGEILMVGDMESDRTAAETYGCRFEWASNFFGEQS